MADGQRLQVSVGSIRGLSLEQVEWHQSRCRSVHVVRRAVRLLQLRQLGVSAIVRVVQYAVVLQWPQDPDLSERQAQDRTLDRERLAVVRNVQQRAWRGRANPVASERNG